MKISVVLQNRIRAITLRSPFETPQLLSRWLLSSGCWAGSCLVGFQLFCYGLVWLWPSDNAMFLVFGAAGIICCLMWQRVIAVGWRLWSSHDSGPALNALAGLWLLLLTLAFVASVLGIAFGALRWLALSGDSGTSSGGSWGDC